jgi:hypothetical protein
MSTLARTNLILGAILVIQVIVLLLLPKEGSPKGPSQIDPTIAGRMPFNGLNAKDVRSVTITSGDGKVVKLAAAPKKEGEQELVWSVANRDGFPARGADVEKIVDAARKVTLVREVTRQEKRYPRLNVADGVMHAHVEIGGEGGKKLADFRVGDSKDFSSIYLRMTGDPAVYEAQGASTWEFPVAVTGLVDNSFLDLPSDEVARVKVVTPTESFEVMKVVPESRPASAPTTRETESQPESAPASRAAETKPVPKWVVVGNESQTLDKTKVESWIRGLTRLNLSDPIGKAKEPAYGFDKPAATVTITMHGGKETVITIGAERKDERDHYATATGKDFVVTIPSWTVTDQFQKKLKDLEPGGAPARDEHDHEGHVHDTEPK